MAIHNQRNNHLYSTPYIILTGTKKLQHLKWNVLHLIQVLIKFWQILNTDLNIIRFKHTMVDHRLDYHTNLTTRNSVQTHNLLPVALWDIIPTTNSNIDNKLDQNMKIVINLWHFRNKLNLFVTVTLKLSTLFLWIFCPIQYPYMLFFTPILKLYW